MTDIPRNVLIQHPSGKLISDHREEGKNLMRRAGVDPDAPLNVDWEKTPDRRNNRNAEEIGDLMRLHRYSMPSDPFSSVADCVLGKKN